MPATIMSLLLILVGLAQPDGPGSPSRPNSTSISPLRCVEVTDLTHADFAVGRSHRDEVPAWTISEADTDEEQDDSCEEDPIGNDQGLDFASRPASRKVSSVLVVRTMARVAPRSPLLRC